MSGKWSWLLCWCQSVWASKHSHNQKVGPVLGKLLSRKADCKISGHQHGSLTRGSGYRKKEFLFTNCDGQLAITLFFLVLILVIVVFLLLSIFNIISFMIEWEMDISITLIYAAHANLGIFVAWSSSHIQPVLLIMLLLLSSYSRKKALRSLYSLKGTINKKHISFRAFTTLFDSLIKPIALYGATIWTADMPIIRNYTKQF